MEKVLDGLVAVVTGSGRGIGRQVALEMAQHGASVVVNDVGRQVDGFGQSEDVAAEVVATIEAAGGQATANHDSVADFDSAERLIRTAVDAYGKLDVLVNVAGIERGGMVFNLSAESWQAVIDVHLTGTFNTTRHASAIMRAQRSGRIINFTSDAWTGTLGHANYGAAKGGIASFTFAVARELGKYGVTTNAIAPVASTRMTMSDDVRAGLVKRFEGGHITEEQLDGALNMPGPEHVGPFVAYLASPQAADVNGQIFHVEGGRISIFSMPVEERAIYRDLASQGRWTVEDIAVLMPQTLLAGYSNPSPRQPA